MKRRHVLAALFAATVASGATAQTAPAPQRYAVLSAVGDQMTVVRARTQTGSRLDRNDHEVAALPDSALDRLVLKHVDGTLKRAVPAAEVAALAVASGRLLDVQRQALARNRPSGEMARAFADVLPAGGTDRLLLVIKHRADASIPVAGGNIGLGRLEGTGFYVDRVTLLRSPDTGLFGTGFLAPFAYVRLVLADASGRVLAERIIEAAESFHMSDARAGLQPWDMMTPGEKVAALDRLLQRHIESELPRLFAAASQ
ncbi:MAG TPA: hypothetical protein VFX81_05545 [Burkholderiaceae bacterium]|nr:hypothetical protein [Burkholderiaceae bacterium]